METSNQQTTSVEEIVKYSNRKLYSKAESRYLTLVQLGQKAKSGVQFRVVEKQTGKDITEKVTLLSLAALV